MPYGICKVVPPAGWSPQPWSGKPPKGATDLTPLTLGGGEDNVLKAAAQLCSGEDGKVAVTPRMQPVQLFNKAFEPAGRPPAARTPAISSHLAPRALSAVSSTPTMLPPPSPPCAPSRAHT